MTLTKVVILQLSAVLFVYRYPFGQQSSKNAVPSESVYFSYQSVGLKITVFSSFKIVHNWPSPLSPLTCVSSCLRSSDRTLSRSLRARWPPGGSPSGEGCLLNS